MNHREIIVCVCLLVTHTLSQSQIGAIEKDPSGSSSHRQLTDLRQDPELFKRFLEQPYPVSNIIFQASVNESINGKQSPKGFATIEAGFQEEMFYRHDVSEGTDQPVFSTRGSAVGRSFDRSTWFIDGKSAIGKGGTVMIAAENGDMPRQLSPVDPKVAYAIRELRAACWFGFMLLVPHSVHWEGNQFTA